jgi:hypothetical protein
MLQKDQYVPQYWETRKCTIAKALRRPMEHDLMIGRLLGTYLDIIFPSLEKY